MNVPTYYVVLALWIVVPSCKRAALECPRSNGDLRGMNLLGRWILEGTPDSAIGFENARLGRSLIGSVQLNHVDTSRAVVYTGTFAADLRSVGLAKSTGEVLAFIPPGDTVRIILDPTALDGNIELVGRCRFDQLVGRWVRAGEPSSAWGHFVLRR